MLERRKRFESEAIAWLLRSPRGSVATAEPRSGPCQKRLHGHYEVEAPESESDDGSPPTLAIADNPYLAPSVPYTEPVDEYHDPFNEAIEVIRGAGMDESVYMLYHKIKNKGDDKDKKVVTNMTRLISALRKNGRRHMTNFKAVQRNYPHM